MTTRGQIAGGVDSINLAGSGGSNLVGFLQAGTGAVARTVQGKERDIVSVKDFGAVGDGVTDDTVAIEAWLDALEVAGGTGYVPAGTYAYAASPNFARAGVNISCDRAAIFKHTGTGNAFIIDGGATGSGILGLRFDNLTIQGNSNSTNGLYVRSIHHSVFIHPRVRGCATTGAGILTEWCVVNEWHTPTVSVNDGALSPVPLYGMKQTRRASGGEVTTTQLLLNPIFEGLTNVGGAGLYIDYAGGTTVTGGTSEANTNGVIITSHSYGLNQFQGLDCENNSSYDFDIDVGVYNTFIGIYGLGNVRFTGTSNANVWVGGRINTVNMAAATSRNVFVGVTIVTTRTDSSASGFENEWINCTAPGGLTYTNKLRGGTASNYVPNAYSTSITVDAFAQDIVKIPVTDGVAFAMNAPTNPTRGQVLTFTITNTSGGAAGALTWNAVFKMGAAWTQPATGFNRSIEFYYNGTNWIEKNRSAADVTN